MSAYPYLVQCMKNKEERELQQAKEWVKLKEERCEKTETQLELL